VGARRVALQGARHCKERGGAAAPRITR
jgi:hypothetical protein